MKILKLAILISFLFNSIAYPYENASNTLRPPMLGDKTNKDRLESAGKLASGHGIAEVDMLRKAEKQIRERLANLPHIKVKEEVILEAIKDATSILKEWGYFDFDFIPNFRWKGDGRLAVYPLVELSDLKQKQTAVIFKDTDVDENYYSFEIALEKLNGTGNIPVIVLTRLDEESMSRRLFSRSMNPNSVHFERSMPATLSEFNFDSDSVRIRGASRLKCLPLIDPVYARNPHLRTYKSSIMPDYHVGHVEPVVAAYDAAQAGKYDTAYDLVMEGLLGEDYVVNIETAVGVLKALAAHYGEETYKGKRIGEIVNIVNRYKANIDQKNMKAELRPILVSLKIGAILKTKGIEVDRINKKNLEKLIKKVDKTLERWNDFGIEYTKPIKITRTKVYTSYTADQEAEMTRAAMEGIYNTSYIQPQEREVTKELVIIPSRLKVVPAGTLREPKPKDFKPWLNVLQRLALKKAIYSQFNTTSARKEALKVIYDFIKGNISSLPKKNKFIIAETVKAIENIPDLKEATDILLKITKDLKVGPYIKLINSKLIKEALNAKKLYGNFVIEVQRIDTGNVTYDRQENEITIYGYALKCNPQSDLSALKITPTLFNDKAVVLRPNSFKDALAKLKNNEGNIPVVLLTQETKESIIAKLKGINLAGVQFMTPQELGLENLQWDKDERVSLIDGIDDLKCIPLTKTLCEAYKDLQKVRDQV